MSQLFRHGHLYRHLLEYRQCNRIDLDLGQRVIWNKHQLHSYCSFRLSYLLILIEVYCIQSILYTNALLLQSLVVKPFEWMVDGGWLLVASSLGIFSRLFLPIRIFCLHRYLSLPFSSFSFSLLRMNPNLKWLNN